MNIKEQIIELCTRENEIDERYVSRRFGNIENCTELFDENVAGKVVGYTAWSIDGWIIVKDCRNDYFYALAI
jgi:hypothetical protein